MDDSYSELFRSVEESPSYWMQVALLEFMQSLDSVSGSKGVVTRKELAKRVGVSPATLSRWLNGNENITVSTMCRLAAAVGAAVHIHVADHTKKGRWKEEPSEWEMPQQHTRKEETRERPPESLPHSSARTVVYLAERRHTTKKVSQDEDLTMLSDEPLPGAAYG